MAQSFFLPDVTSNCLNSSPKNPFKEISYPVFYPLEYALLNRRIKPRLEACIFRKEDFDWGCNLYRPHSALRSIFENLRRRQRMLFLDILVYCRYIYQNSYLHQIFGTGVNDALGTGVVGVFDKLVLFTLKCLSTLTIPALLFA